MVERAHVHVAGGEIVSVERSHQDDDVGCESVRGHATPGFVDAVCHVGLDGGAVERALALTPELRAIDAFEPRRADVRALARGGTTALGVVATAANVSAGRCGAVAIGATGTTDVLASAGPHVFAFRSPALGNGRVPATSAGARALLTAAFAGRLWRTPAEADPPTAPEALEYLAALRREPVLVHVSDADSARAAAETLRGASLAPTFVGLHGTELDPVATARLGAPCVVTGLGYGDSVQRLRLPGALAALGVSVGLSTGSSDVRGPSLRDMLALAVANGLPTDAAVPAVTSAPAKALGVAHRVGTVAAGRRADLLVFDDWPWRPAARITHRTSAGRLRARGESR